MQKQIARLWANPGRTASLVTFGVMIVLVLATFHSYGISNDEEVQQTYGEPLIRFYASGFTDDNAFHYRNLFFYGGLFDLIAASIGPHQPMPIYEWRHLLTAIIGLIGMWGTWRLARLLSNDAWACVAVGAVGTLAHYATLTALVELFGFDPVLGSVLGFLSGAVVNYVLNYRLTFHRTKRHREALSKFLAVAGSGFVLNALLMMFLVKGLEIPYLLAQIAVTGLLLFWHYALNAIWTFR